jgi:hypothetical protein
MADRRAVSRRRGGGIGSSWNLSKPFEKKKKKERKKE